MSGIKINQEKDREIDQEIKRIKKTLIYFRVIVLILCGFGLGLYYINMNHQVTALGYQLEAQKEKVAMLQRDYKQLELKAAEPNALIGLRKLRLASWACISLIVSC